jgi:hypothetical protein
MPWGEGRAAAWAEARRATPVVRAESSILLMRAMVR